MSSGDIYEGQVAMYSVFFAF